MNKFLFFVGALSFTASARSAHATWQLQIGLPTNYTPARATAFLNSPSATIQMETPVTQHQESPYSSGSREVTFKWTWVPNPALPAGTDPAPVVNNVSHTYKIANATAEARAAKVFSTRGTPTPTSTAYVQVQSTIYTPYRAYTSVNAGGTSPAIATNFIPSGTFTETLAGAMKTQLGKLVLTQSADKLTVYCTADVRASASASAEWNSNSSIMAFVGPLTPATPGQANASATTGVTIQTVSVAPAP